MVKAMVVHDVSALRSEEIRQGKRQIIEVSDDTSDEDIVTIPLTHACDIPVHARKKPELIIH